LRGLLAAFRLQRTLVMDGNGPLRDPLPLQGADVARFGPARPSVLIILADLLMTWIERGRSRHALALLDDRMLQDIGVDRAKAHVEIQKPFWRG
jgi:uncharacterized protein YjiS (DUF1127 family)